MTDLSACSSSSSWPLPGPNPNSNSNPNPNPNSPNFNFLPIPQHEPSISSDESQFEDESDPYMYEGSTEDHEHDYEGIQDVESFSNFNFSPSSSSIFFLDNPNPNSNLQDSTSSMQSSIPSLLHLSFNQDFGCFASVTNHGFLVYNCDPFREIFQRNFVAGGIRIVEMLFRCNILALVSGDNKVMIWDDNRTQCIGELSFRSEVRAVRLRRDRIIVVLEQKIFVYNFVDLKLLHQIETVVNTNGLCAVSQLSGSLVLVCPGLQKGQVRVEHYVSKRTKFIVAHDSRIACFALTQDGRILATASTKGTLVRIFDTLDGSLLQEVRRGADRAEIYSLAFSSTAQWLAVSSDKGTVHVFSLKVNSGLPGNDKSRNSSDPNVVVPSTGSSLSFIKGVLPKYFSSEWSVAKFRINEGSRYIVAFGQENNTIVILGMDGSFYKCQFDSVTGGEMTQLEFYNFLKPAETL